jgi:hypothetical protein
MTISSSSPYFSFLADAADVAASAASAASAATATGATTTRLRVQQPPPVRACAGCLENSIESWGDVLGDNPIARKAAGLAQIGDGGGDPTPPLHPPTRITTQGDNNNARDNDHARAIPAQPASAAAEFAPIGPTTTATAAAAVGARFRPANGAVLPGPAPTVPHQAAVHESEATKLSVTSKLQHGARDTLENKCFYCTECASEFGQKCYMQQNRFEAKYADGVCLGLSFLWVRAAGWDGFVEALSSEEGRRVIAQIMDGQEQYMEKTNFPPNYARGLMDELYHIPPAEVDVEMVELGEEASARETFEGFIRRAVDGGPCIVILFSAKHAMAVRVTGESGIGTDERPTRFHFFDPNYGQFGMSGIDEFVQRLWQFVLPEGGGGSGAMPSYGNVWAYVRHRENQHEHELRSGGGGEAEEHGELSAAILERDTELGSIGYHEKLAEMPFVGRDGLLPDVNGEGVEGV